MFNKNCLKRKLDRSEEFLKLAGKLYDPTKVVRTIEENQNEEVDACVNKEEDEVEIIENYLDYANE